MVQFYSHVVLEYSLILLIFPRKSRDFRYMQHRAMHDFKPLWIYGHAYHHQWKEKGKMKVILKVNLDFPQYREIRICSYLENYFQMNYEVRIFFTCRKNTALILISVNI